MEQSTRVLDIPIYRKALIYAFQMKTPRMQWLSPHFIRRQLRNPEMFQEFQEALRLMNAFYKQVNIDFNWEIEEWNSEVKNNPYVINFLYNYCKPNIANGRCGSSDAEAIFDLKPPLFKICKKRCELQMDVD